jgi:hypothetical protein
MNQVTTQTVLEQESATYRGRGGISAENRSYGFRPAFLDTESGAVYLSCYTNGQPAPFHLLDGLPDELVLARNPAGRVTRAKGCVSSGFVRDGRFYTREEAAWQVSAELSLCARAA